MPTEIEFKYLLSSKAYQTLRTALAPKKLKTVKQRNAYFDTAQGTLRRRAMALRVREVGGKRTLTVKKDLKTRGFAGLSKRLEYECSVPESFEAQLKQKGVDGLLGYLPVRKLKELLPAGKHVFRPTVEMVTERSAYRLGGGLVLELDAVRVARSTFYEAELETRSPAAARRLLQKLFKDLGVNARPVRRTKLARALREQRK